MARNSFSTGANMRGFVDIYANNVSLVETNQINNIKNIFVDNSRIKTSNEEPGRKIFIFGEQVDVYKKIFNLLPDRIRINIT